jgi:RNA polymerase sigma-70 factor (ECF subfamily)
MPDKLQPALPEDSAANQASQTSQRAHAELIEKLFREHNDALIRFLTLRLHSSQAAREVAQEAYVRLLSLHEPGAISYLRAFLFRTAANLAVDRQRREDVHSRATALPLFHEFTDGRTPERRVAGVQEIQYLDGLLAELPPKCRQAFILNRFYGVDFAAIAQEMGMSERSVRAYVERALLHCRERMDSDRHRESGND